MTTFPANIGDDFAAFDGLEAAVIRARDGSRSDPVSILASPIRRSEVEASKGAYRASDLSVHARGEWEMPYAPGDWIDFRGDELVIMEASHRTLGSRWVFTCRRASIAGPEVIEFTVQRRTGETDVLGSPVATWTTVSPPTRGRLQRDGGTPGTIVGERDAGDVRILYVAGEVDLRPGDTIVVDGQRFRWTNYDRVGRLGELPRIELREMA